MKYQKSKKLIIIVPLLILFFLLAATYGRWEFQSYRYAKEFEQPIKNASDAGCLIGYPTNIKVMKYSSDKSNIFIKDESGSTYLANFRRENGEWTMTEEVADRNFDTICHFDVINTTLGGSADDIYWYN